MLSGSSLETEAFHLLNTSYSRTRYTSDSCLAHSELHVFESVDSGDRHIERNNMRAGGLSRKEGQPARSRENEESSP